MRAPARAGAGRSDSSALLAGCARTARRKQPRMRGIRGAHATWVCRAPAVAAYAVDDDERSASVFLAFKGEGLACRQRALGRSRGGAGRWVSRGTCWASLRLRHSGRRDVRSAGNAAGSQL